MSTSKKDVEIMLSRSNAAAAQIVAAVKKTSVEKLISSCLEGSTNPNG